MEMQKISDWLNPLNFYNTSHFKSIIINHTRQACDETDEIGALIEIGVRMDTREPCLYELRHIFQASNILSLTFNEPLHTNTRPSLTYSEGIQIHYQITRNDTAPSTSNNSFITRSNNFTDIINVKYKVPNDAYVVGTCDRNNHSTPTSVSFLRVISAKLITRKVCLGIGT